MRPGWQKKLLGDICESKLGKTLNASTDQGEVRPYLCAVNVKWDTFDFATIKTTPFDADEIKKYSVRKGDLLVCEGGETGRAAIWDREEPIQYQNALHRIRFKEGTILPRFCLHYLRFLKLSGVLDKEYSHGATILHLVTKSLYSIPIEYPSLTEQQRIVDILDREFAKIDALKANAEKSLQAAKDLFRHISNGYYNEPSPVSKLGDECIFVRGPFGGSLKKSCFVSSGYPVYEQQHAIYSTFTFRYFVNEEKYNEMKRFTTHPGDLIMSCSGTIGKVAIIPEDAPIGIINQALLKLTPKKKILPEYLKWYMQSISFEKDIQRHSKGAAIQNVASVAILKEIAIPVPTIEKQKQIVARLDDLNERCNALQENYQKTFALCDDLKQSLLRKAFNGEL